MNNIVVSFGYNTEQNSYGFTAWNNMGTKYNFNIEGNALGIFSSNGHNYLLSQITRSFGDDCMVGTVDAREIIVESPEVLLSNNEPTMESMTISRMLSTAMFKKELASGISLEQTIACKELARLGIDLVRQIVELSEKVTVCGIESEHFRYFQEKYMGKSK